MNYDYIKQGDCLELMKEIPDRSVDCVVTDPPYLLETKGGGFFSESNQARRSYGARGNSRFVMKEIDGMKNGVLFFREKGVKLYGNVKTKRTYFETTINIKDKKLYRHPTVKPIDIVRTLIVNSSQEGDIILDPFLGSGTTAVAAIKEHRHYIGFELQPEYFEIARKRINNEKAQLTLF